VTLTVTDNHTATNAVSHDVSTTLPNALPTASFTNTCDELACSFDASGSTDTDGTISTYAWDFGDGNSDFGVVVQHAFATAGPHTVTLTVTDNRGGTGTSSRSIDVTSFPIVAADAFARTFASGFGTADTGGAYTYPAGQAPNFSVGGGAGTAVVPTAGASRQAWLASVSARDVRAEASVTSNVAPSGSFGETFILQARRVAANTEYRARLRFAPGGAIRLALAKATGVNTDILIGSEIVVPGLTFTPGTAYRMKFEATGVSPTSLRAKVWRVGDPEPATWQITATDSEATLQTSGSVGMHTYLNTSNTAPVTFTVDDYVVRRIGAQ
jgi:PKD repeat protein